LVAITQEAQVLSVLKRLFGGTAGGARAETPFDPVDYNGYRIRPDPFAEGGQYQTAGVIEKDGDAGVRQHRFVRAEKHASRDEAAHFSITKAKQIINEQGDRIFDPR
jgi:hypothetical protein